MSLFFSDVEVDGSRCAVLIDNATVAAIGPDLVRPPGSDHVDGSGGALLPGLHDHHVHLLAAAAAARSLHLGPPDVRTAGDLRRVLRAAGGDPGTWIRAIGYHESVAGPLDRHVLDLIVDAQPLRVQHRSGAMWFLNSRGLELAGLDQESASFVERDEHGRPTGRLWRSENTLRVGDDINVDDLRRLSDAAARHGVTGFTDAAPHQTPTGLEVLASAHDSGAIRQRLTLMSPPGLTVAPREGVDVGPVKVLLDDIDLPALDELVETVTLAHRDNRAVAIHCVTDLQAALALSAINVAGPLGRDRIEHGSVIPEELDHLARSAEITVVTQPHFVAERGDDYRRDVPAQFHDALYRARTLLDAGIALAGGTDAPFGAGDPWVAIAAATNRTTESGAILGPHERLTPTQAVNLFTGSPHSPGRARRLVVGTRADLCLLSLDTASALANPSSKNVRMTIIAGQVVFDG